LRLRKYDLEFEKMNEVWCDVPQSIQLSQSHRDWRRVSTEMSPPPWGGGDLKSTFLSALTCRTQAWMGHANRHPVPLNVGDQFLMAEGIEVGKRAWNIFPDGQYGGNVALTQQLIHDQNVPVIFEAAFHIDGYAAKADVLRRKGDAWELIEVKASVNEHVEFVNDMAYTAMVLHRAGVTISKASLMLLSRDYRLGMSDSDLFTLTERTDQVLSSAAQLVAKWDEVKEFIGSNERPDPQLILECRNCPYFGKDCIGNGVENHIFDLPRLSHTKFCQLQDIGVQTIDAIPDDFELTEIQERVRDCVVKAEPVVGGGLTNVLAAIQWPAFYLDFETVKTAIPLYPDVAPHEDVVTQYSLHVCSTPGQVTSHHEFLADPSRDCRRELAERLLHDLRGDGSIIVHHAQMETGVICGLADLLPDLRDALMLLLPRIVDLERIIIDHFNHPDFGGRTSIKAVLPALVPDMSYEGMEIGDGFAAVAAFAKLARGEFEGEEAERMKRDLLSYCELDTMAMVRVHERLLAYAGAD